MELRQLIREMIKQELEETSTTGNVAGYQTPFAFRGNASFAKAKQKKNASQAGYKMVPGHSDEADSLEGEKEPFKPKPFGEAFEPEEKALKSQEQTPKDSMKDRAELQDHELVDKIELDKTEKNQTAKQAHKPLPFGHGGKKAKIFGVKPSDTPSVKKAHTPVPMGEGVSKYEKYKKDESLSPQQKIGRAIAEINSQLKTISEVLTMNARLKQEHNLGSTNLWKRTTKHLMRMESKLLHIAHQIKELKA